VPLEWIWPESGEVNKGRADFFPPSVVLLDSIEFYLHLWNFW
jgi:hypothetical protein